MAKHGEGQPIINSDDVIDIENAKNDFKFDNKASIVTNTNLNIN